MRISHERSTFIDFRAFAIDTRFCRSALWYRLAAGIDRSDGARQARPDTKPNKTEHYTIHQRSEVGLALTAFRWQYKVYDWFSWRVLCLYMARSTILVLIVMMTWSIAPGIDASFRHLRLLG